MHFHADLVTFTEESNNGKLHFLSSESFADSIMRNSNYYSINVKHLFDDSGRTPCRRRTFWRLLFQADKEGHFFRQERVDNLNDTKINQWEKACPKITKKSQSNILITSQSNILITSHSNILIMCMLKTWNMFLSANNGKVRESTPNRVISRVTSFLGYFVLRNLQIYFRGVFRLQSDSCNGIYCF